MAINLGDHQLSGEQKFELAHEYLNRVFPFLPTRDDFQFNNEIFQKAKFTFDEMRLAHEVKDKMEILILNDFNYAEKRNPKNYGFCLNDLGREVKAAGGIKKYNELLLKEKIKEKYVTELQLTKLEGDIIDLSRKLSDYPKTRKMAEDAHKRGGKSLKISIAAIIISGLMLTITVTLLLLKYYKVSPFDK